MLRESGETSKLVCGEVLEAKNLEKKQAICWKDIYVN